MIALRVAAVALFILMVCASVYVVVATSMGADADVQDTYYIAAHIRYLSREWLWPTLVLMLVFIATWARSRRGIGGLWVMLGGAALMGGAGAVSNLGQLTLIRAREPYAHVAETLQWYGRVVMLAAVLKLAGFVCVVIGLVWWALAYRRAKGAETV